MRCKLQIRRGKAWLHLGSSAGVSAPPRAPSQEGVATLCLLTYLWARSGIWTLPPEPALQHLGFLLFHSEAEARSHLNQRANNLSPPLHWHEPAEPPTWPSAGRLDKPSCPHGICTSSPSLPPFTGRIVPVITSAGLLWEKAYLTKAPPPSDWLHPTVPAQHGWLAGRRHCGGNSLSF